MGKHLMLCIKATLFTHEPWSIPHTQLTSAAILLTKIVRLSLNMSRLHTMEYENVLQFAVTWYMSIHPYTPSSDTSDSRGGGGGGVKQSRMFWVNESDESATKYSGKAIKCSNYYNFSICLIHKFIYIDGLVQNCSNISNGDTAVWH